MSLPRHGDRVLITGTLDCCARFIGCKGQIVDNNIDPPPSGTSYCYTIILDEPHPSAHTGCGRTDDARCYNFNKNDLKHLQVLSPRVKISNFKKWSQAIVR